MVKKCKRRNPASGAKLSAWGWSEDLFCPCFFLLQSKRGRRWRWPYFVHDFLPQSKIHPTEKQKKCKRRNPASGAKLSVRGRDDGNIFCKACCRYLRHVRRRNVWRSVAAARDRRRDCCKIVGTVGTIRSDLSKRTQVRWSLRSLRIYNSP